MRKVIQVSIAHSNSFWGNNSLIVALCDDGTMWERSLFNNHDDKKWKKLQCVPQEQGDPQ